MRINADFDQRVVMHADEIEWLDSPMAGVTRRPLDRIGDEVARATTIVRYAPNSHFSPHVHGGGEEFIVLDGVFSDEHGDFPAGSYIRNPPTSKHTPGSDPGTTIFVKLWQFDPEDRTHIRVNFDKVEPVEAAGRPGVKVTPLFKDERETVRIEAWAPGTEGEIAAPGGAELLVLEGAATESGEALRVQSWVRVPDGRALKLKAGPDGIRFWLKIGHLRYVAAPVAA
ncbi:MAG: cupin domain-containing protein [Candidatus Competibacterales bacterium]